MLPKNLHLGASALLIAAATVHASSFPCSSFWPSLQPGDANYVGGNCLTYPGYPQVVGTTEVIVVYTEEWQGDLGIIDDLLNEAIVQSIAIYDTLSTPPDMVIILGAGNDPANETAALSTVIPSSKGPCQIQRFRWWSDNAGSAMSPVAMQGVAHEIYHCVQRSVLGHGHKRSPTNWVFEASADYFSNVVFPSANGEVAREIYYQPDVPIWQQKSYVPALWFQSLERSRGIVYLHDFVMSTTFTSSDNEERARLGAIPGFTDDFYLFATQFSFNRIYDTDGQPDFIQNPPKYHNAVWSISDDGTEGSVELHTVPFTISGYSLQLDAGQRVRICSSATAKQRVAWRRKGEVYWSDVPHVDSSSSSEGVLKIPCSGSSQEILILIISTTNKSSDKVEIHFVQQQKDDKCCNGSTVSDSSECPTSSQLSSTSSSSSSSSSSTSSAPKPTASSPGSDSDSGSCTGSSIPMDPCLTSNSWALDVPSTRELMKKQLFALGRIKVTEVEVSGAGGLEFGKKSAKFTYDELKTAVSVKAEGLKAPISVVVNGVASGRFFIKAGGSGSGTACLSYTSGKGTAEAVLAITGKQTFDLSPGGGYLKDMDIDYTCSDGKLTIASSGSDTPLTSGGPVWGPFSYNAA
ncbi:hypothetical protein EDB81DRAFT_492986 [Dactylonectria macrodidyma]|uniref:Uncharacterized protein n=1 Tax=Dactylonectria macrodidyma TaxID=307937 RepID=A0A9P9EW80_9HYPO|nr:hypothetical protein EDB81DRAFT_492986 [Dactylonectria macrodidyma]